MKKAIIAALAICICPGFVFAQQDIEFTKAVLYSPDSVLKERGPSPEETANYLKEIKAIGTKFLLDVHLEIPTAGFIVVGLKPRKQKRFWIEFDAPVLTENQLQDLETRLMEIEAPEVKYGPVAFAWTISVLGGQVSDKQPIPKEWRDVVTKSGKESLLVPDQIFENIWPDER